MLALSEQQQEIKMFKLLTESEVLSSIVLTVVHSRVLFKGGSEQARNLSLFFSIVLVKSMSVSMCI